MKQRMFGSTGIRVSEVVFGAGAVGGILVHKDDATKREAVRRALAGGINWIDTAAQYGNGKSEESLGWLLPEARATPSLSTKFNLDVANLTDIPAQIEDCLKASLAGRSDEALTGLKRVKTEMAGEAASVDAEHGIDAVETSRDLKRLSDPSSVLARSLKRNKYDELRGTRWARLFEGA